MKVIISYLRKKRFFFTEEEHALLRKVEFILDCLGYITIIGMFYILLVVAAILDS